MMLEYTLKTSHALKLAFNIAIIMLAGYGLESATGILETSRHGMPRLVMICAYIAYMVFVATKKAHQVQQFNALELEEELAELELKLGEYDQELGKAAQILEGKETSMQTLREKLERYEDRIIQDGNEVNRLTNVAKQKVEALEAKDQELKKALSQLELAQTQIKSMGDEIASYKRKERQLKEARQERARKAALAKHAQAEEESAQAEENPALAE